MFPSPAPRIYMGQWEGEAETYVSMLGIVGRYYNKCTKRELMSPKPNFYFLLFFFFSGHCKDPIHLKFVIFLLQYLAAWVTA